MNPSMFNSFKWLFYYSTLCISNSYAQDTFEFAGGLAAYQSYVGKIPLGPTSIPQTLQLLRNYQGSRNDSLRFNELSSPLGVTFILDDQTYIMVPQHVTGMTFGALPGASSRHVKPITVVNNAYFLPDSLRYYFSAHPRLRPGQGIDFSVNTAVQIFLSAKPLFTVMAATSDSSRYYYGKLRIEFSRPVNDPVLSLFGLGATTNFADQHLGFSTELELQTSELKVQKLSGTQELLIDETETKILHSKARIDGQCGGGAACGSIVIKGKNISKLVFKVFLRTDGGPGIWSNGKVINSGDSWHLAVSLEGQ